MVHAFTSCSSATLEKTNVQNMAGKSTYKTQKRTSEKVFLTPRAEIRLKCRLILILIINSVVVGTWNLLVTRRRKTATVNEGERRRTVLVQPYWLTIVIYLKFPIILKGTVEIDVFK